jgi:uncharacterized repeat protein (TIGR01451 family)
VRGFARRILVGLAGLVMMGASVPAARAQDTGPPPQVRSCFDMDLSTGTSQPFVPDAIGTVDPDWWVTASPDPNLVVPGPVYSIAPVNVWVTTPGANWVDPFNTGFVPGGSGNDVPGDYVYATTFTLNGALYSNFVLRVNAYAADDQVELFLDGSPTALGPPASFNSPAGGPLTVPLAAGTHTLEAKVHNAILWTGLLVDAHVTADCRPDLAIKKGPRGDFVAGQPGSYLVTVSNVGPGTAAGPIYVTDTLPVGAAFISAAGAGWTCTNSGQTVSCVNPGPLPPSSSLPAIVITVMVPQGVPAVENCAVVDSKDDANMDNNRSCIGTQVDPGQPAAICGVKWNDLNGNGIRDGNEPPLGGWTIQIKDAFGNVVATVTTAKDGTYCFRELKPGTYTLSEVMQQGWQQTYPLSPGTHTVSLISAQVLQGINFGNKARPDDRCCLTFQFPQGVRDNFQTGNGPEPATPSPGFIKWLPAGGVLTGYDEPQVDHIFATTLSLPQGNCIDSAYLTVRMRPNGSGATVGNDSVNLQFIGNNGSPVPGTPVWGAHMGSGWPNNLLPNPWGTATYPNGQTFTFNLASLPGGGNLIPSINSLRFLDVMVQDDTSVDYLVLTVKFCQCTGQGNPNTNPTTVVPAPGPVKKP